MKSVDRRLVIEFRSRAEYRRDLDAALVGLVGILQLPVEQARGVLEKLTDGIAELVYAKELCSIDARFADAELRIALVYDAVEDQESELDLLPFQMLEWKDVSMLTVRLRVHDLARAQFLGSERLIGLADEVIQIEVVGEAGEQSGEGDDSDQKNEQQVNAATAPTDLAMALAGNNDSESSTKIARVESDKGTAAPPRAHDARRSEHGKKQ